MATTNSPNEQNAQAQARAGAERAQRAAAEFLRNGAYATVGATDAAVSYLRQLGEKAGAELSKWQVPRDRDQLSSSARGLVASAAQRFEQFTIRGRKVVESIQRGDATRRAMERTQAARGRVEAATTSVRRAVATTTEAAAEAATAVGEETDVDYDKLTVEELRALAREREIAGRSEMSKSELIEALRNA